ncbi:MAG: DUF1538 domain-containing protein [Magnetococcales bacterium]|nr:DUF1538 domain-containing protein [Magnetococcales bacterium]NGZ26421.1 DUF1538 domain-containing protein [Magnetococcales bacterium]
MELLLKLWQTFTGTFLDVIPIVMATLGFQKVILRQEIPNLKRLLVGLVYVMAGLVFFLVGLEQALFPVGELMAKQLTDPQFLFGSATTPDNVPWYKYYWVYIFAALIGFSTTIAEPALLAVAMKASEVSMGTIRPFPLRIAVAIGVAIGIALGSFRIVTGTSLAAYIIVGYIIVIIQTQYAPRTIIPLAYDSGGVTTSTVTVPLVAALGLGLASTIPGRSPAIDGFGLIAFASLFPMITVMGYAQIVDCLTLKAVAARKHKTIPLRKCALRRKPAQSLTSEDDKP